METPLIIAVASGLGVVLICIIILVGYLCYRRSKKPENTSSIDEESHPDIQVDNVDAPNVIMTRKDRTEDLFTGKRTPFGVHNSINSIPDAIDEEEQKNKGLGLQNGVTAKEKLANRLSVRSVHSVYSTSSNAPSFSEHAQGEANSSMYY